MRGETNEWKNNKNDESEVQQEKWFMSGVERDMERQTSPDQWPRLHAPLFLTEKYSFFFLL